MRKRFRRRNLPDKLQNIVRFCLSAYARGKKALPRKKVSTKFSIIAACYNVEAYIDDFFFSLANQTIDPSCLEIIAVDDGSTDATATKIRAWAKNFAGTIRYIYQPNQKQAVARNNGLSKATGDWICFADPDDFFSRNYIEQVHNEISGQEHKRPLSLISCNLVFFREAKAKIDDSHALRYRFYDPRTVLKAADLKNHMQLSASHAWFRREFVTRHGIQFDQRIVPTFEDGHFVNRYLILNPDTDVVFLKAPVYYYRKRELSESTVDGSSKTKEWYLDQLKYGYIDLLNQAQKELGSVPRFIQRTVLYDVFWRFKYLSDHPERGAILSNAEQAEFHRLLGRILSQISDEVINSFSLAGCKEKEKVGLLGYKATNRPITMLFVRQYDKAKGLFQLSYYSCSATNNLSVRVEDKSEPMRFQSRYTCAVLNRDFFYEHFFWVKIALNENISVYLDGQICIFGTNNRPIGVQVSGANLIALLRPPVIKGSQLKRKVRKARREAKGRRAREKYGDCWLVMDRDNRADDNAEHFYRYLMNTGKAGKVYFVLRTSSPDWSRLKAEGFHLIAFKSKEHINAFLNAKLLISSDAVESLLYPLPKELIVDRLNHEFVFLQHGIIKDDLSRWLNSKIIARFVTSTFEEYESIVHRDSPYKFSEKEVVLTGLCRHDQLLQKSSERKTILIMPTWRISLSVNHAPKAQRQRKKNDLRSSQYLKSWNALLNSAKLKELAVAQNHKIVFSPHPHMLSDIDCFELPNHVEISPMGTSFQDLFAKAAVLVTDYSSVAFEAAYLDKPVIYYQFDRKNFFSGSENYLRGYFDYTRNGFGPVCTTENETVTNIEIALLQQEDIKYSERRRKSFPRKDGKNCERVYQSIMELEKPLPADSKIHLKSFSEIANAGDVAGKHIVAHFSRSRFELAGKNPLQTANLLGLGSILHWSDRYSVVWGSGFMSESLGLQTKPLRVFSVRGPLSRKMLLAAGCECPELFGDPGILIGDVFPRTENDATGVGIVPHYADRDHPFLDIARREGAKIIDPGWPLPRYLEELRSCETILSSSLHGIIFAHSYGIPASWIRLSNRVVGDGFKFRDYFKSVGFNDADIPLFGEAEDIAGAVKGKTLPRESLDKRAIRFALDEALQFIFDFQAERKWKENGSQQIAIAPGAHLAA